MAPTNTPGRKKREDQYFDVGVQGRRTGVTLKDTGIRDENGLEPTDGIFSSPQKQSTKRTSRKSNGTLGSSEAMDVADSSAPEPTEVLTERRLARDANGMLPLPVQRSPIRTNLGATPRRGSSVGPNSPFRNQSQTPHRASSHPLVARVLDFSVTEVESSVERTSQKTNKLVNGNRSKARRDIYDLPISPEKLDTAEQSVTDTFDESGVQVNGTYGDSPLLQLDGESYAEETIQESSTMEDDIDTSLPPVETSASLAPPKKRGRKRKSEMSEIAETQDTAAQESNVVEETQEAPASAPKRRGRPPRVSNGVETAAASIKEAAPTKKPSKRARLSQEAVEPEEETIEEQAIDPVDEQTEEPEEAEAEEVEAEEPVPEVKTRGRKKKALSEKDTNTKIATGKSQKQKAKQATKTKSVRKPGVPHGLQRIRAQTPAEDDGAGHTRSGRLTYKPLDYWRGERAIFTASERPGLKVIEAICRADDVTPVKHTRSNYERRPGKKQKRTVSVFEEDQDDDGEEPWELEEGTITGRVRIWDSAIGAAPAEDEEAQQLAFASRKIEPRPTPDNPNFCFTKTLTMPFFGAGVIELPPGGYKGMKNSRRFQFLFFVHYGKVAVDVGGNRFVITKGGMWQVPRGNFYSITNETDHPAKIMFSQGCEADAQPLSGEGAAADS